MNEFKNGTSPKNKRYSSHPVKFMVDGKKGLMSKYLWWMWFLTCISIGITHYFAIININKLQIANFIDASIAGLSFSLVVVSAVLEIFNKEEISILFKRKNLINLLTPYVFTSFIFLLLGTISILAPLVSITLSHWVVIIIKYIYISLLTLSLFSLFNICYEIIMNIYFYGFRNYILSEYNNDEK